MFEGVSLTHLMILLLILVLVFGAKRIPEIGSSLGQGVKEFRRSLKEAATDDAALPPRHVPPPRTVSGTLSSSSDPKHMSD